MMWHKLLDILFPPTARERTVRAVNTNTLTVEQKDVFTCKNHVVTTLLSHRDPTVRALIHSAKYYNDTRATTLLGTVLRNFLTQTHIHTPPKKTHYIPIPLSKERLRTRGYNQVLQCLIAASDDVPSIRSAIDTTTLTRIRDCPSQTTLSQKQRRENVCSVFSAESTTLAHARIFLIDDVIATGATLDDAHRALTNAGATDIVCVAIARAHTLSQ